MCRNKRLFVRSTLVLFLLLLFIRSAIAKDDVIVDFENLGLWAWINDSRWVKLNSVSPDLFILSDMDGDGVDEIIADYSSTFGGIFTKSGFGSWTKLHNLAADTLVAGNLDVNNKQDIVISFGDAGLWVRMNDVSWLMLDSAPSSQVVVGDLDGNGEGDVVAYFSPINTPPSPNIVRLPASVVISGSVTNASNSFNGGIYVKRNLGRWSKLHNSEPDTIMNGGLDGNGKDDLVIDFEAFGLWAWMNDSAWLKLNNISADLVSIGDLDGNGQDDVIATFNGLGLWQKLNLGRWRLLSQHSPDKIVVTDIDGSGQDDIVGAFGSTISGIFVKRNQGAWAKLHNFDPQSLEIGMVDSN